VRVTKEALDELERLYGVIPPCSRESAAINEDVLSFAILALNVMPDILRDLREMQVREDAIARNVEEQRRLAVEQFQRLSEESQKAFKALLAWSEVRQLADAIIRSKAGL
jgi:hypothetical protein